MNKKFEKLNNRTLARIIPLVICSIPFFASLFFASSYVDSFYNVNSSYREYANAEYVANSIIGMGFTTSFFMFALNEMIFQAVKWLGYENKKNMIGVASAVVKHNGK